MFDAHEITLFALIIFLALCFLNFALKFFATYEVPAKRYKEILMQQKIRDFSPSELCNEVGKLLPVENGKVETLTVNELNEYGVDLAVVNYLNMLNSQQIKQRAIDCIRQYGIGTCGPPGFFGTTEVHLELEANLAKFLGTEEAIIYSYGFAALSNSLLTYCRKGDLIFCDEKINFALEQGILATKAMLVYFYHNDVKDLQQKLEETTKKDASLKHVKKFLIVEGIYAKTGVICPLPQLVEIAQLYKMRIFVDESISFGVLGKKGQGVTEHFGMNVDAVDMIISSLEGAIGSIGSFCAGSRFIIEQQRLSSLGYIFSASLPTFQAQAAITALKMIENSPEEIFHLQLLSRKVHNFLSNNNNLIVHSDPVSPHKVFNCKSKDNRWKNERQFSEYCRTNGIYLIAAEYGLVMNLNVKLYYQKSTLMDVFSVLDNNIENNQD